MTSRYHLARSVVVLSFGGCALLCGAGLLLAAVLDGVGGEGAGWSFLRGLPLGAAAVLALGMLLCLWRLRRPPVVLTLDADGYDARGVVVRGVRRAAWDEVSRVEVVGRDLVVLLREGGRTTVALRGVEEREAVWVTDLRDRLKDAGQRRQAARDAARSAPGSVDPSEQAGGPDPALPPAERPL